MIVLLGGTGYFGQAFQRALTAWGREYLTLSRPKLDYTRYGELVGFLRTTRPSFLINAAGFAGRPNVDACEIARAETLLGNTLFPQTVAHACEAAGVPWGQIGSGCIYNGAKFTRDGKTWVEPDLSRAEVKKLFRQGDVTVHGFTEMDQPNFSFRQPPCSFYSGTKALAEEALDGAPQTYVWRPRIPFDEFDSARNFLSKLQRYPKVYDNVNSISHLGDFCRACLELWERRAPFGIYNVTNPGWVTSRQVVELIERHLRPDRKFEFWADDAEFYQQGVKSPRSNCILEVSKLLGAGVKMRPVEEALAAALKDWRAA